MYTFNPSLFVFINSLTFLSQSFSFSHSLLIRSLFVLRWSFYLIILPLTFCALCSYLYIITNIFCCTIQYLMFHPLHMLDITGFILYYNLTCMTSRLLFLLVLLFSQSSISVFFQPHSPSNYFLSTPSSTLPNTILRSDFRCFIPVLSLPSLHTYFSIPLFINTKSAMFLICIPSRL